MPDSIAHVTYRSLAAIFVCIVLGATIPAGRCEHLPPKVAPEATTWKPASIFEKNSKDELRKQPRMNLSGAACVPTTPKFTSCLIANDEKKYAQFFSIEGNLLVPKDLIRLSDDDDDPDAEGVAYDGGFFYVTGSHGRSRHGEEKNLSSYTVFRIAVDPKQVFPGPGPMPKASTAWRRAHGCARCSSKTTTSRRISTSRLRRVASTSKELPSGMVACTSGCEARR